ncbi:MAG: hypothetical protein ACE5EC_09290, partial [Phycisphaerae bacterium]
STTFSHGGDPTLPSPTSYYDDTCDRESIQSLCAIFGILTVTVWGARAYEDAWIGITPASE